jgi:hypothetical protein
MDKRNDRLMYLIKGAQEKYSNEHLVIAVPGFLSKKFIAYCAMKEDLQLLLEYVSALRTEITGVQKSAFTYALISLYGKCFTDASKNSYPKLEPSQVFKHGDRHSQTHDDLMSLRHQFIAHRGDSEGEIGISYVLIPKVGTSQSQVRFSQVKQVSFAKDELDKIEMLLKFLIEHLIKKIQKHGQKVNDSLLALFSPEQMQYMMINNVK